MCGIVGIIHAPDRAVRGELFAGMSRGLIPRPILDRRDKIGSETPERQWLAQRQPWVENVLTGDTARRIRVLDTRAALADWQAMLAGRVRFDFRFWRWINLVRWAEKYNVAF